MPRNPKESFCARIWRQLTGTDESHLEDELPATDLALQMRQASILSFSFFFMLALAAAIATFGLIANSAPAIIGAMIIAPLMAPIVSLSYGLVVFDKRLIIVSIVTVIAGVILVVVLSYIITLLIGLRITGSEILNRTSPTVIDLGVGMAAGAAAAFAHTRRSILSSIAGVAIAVALVPPLAVSGIGLALGGEATAEGGLSLGEFGFFSGGADIAAGSFLLFLTNLVGIVAVAILVFISQGYGDWKKALLGLFLFVGFTALLIEPLGEELHRLFVKHRVTRLIVKLSEVRPEIVSGRGKISSINVAYQNDILHVNIDAFMPKDLFRDRAAQQKQLDRFREYLSEDIGEPVVVELDISPVDMIQISSKPPRRQKTEQQADKGE